MTTTFGAEQRRARLASRHRLLPQRRTDDVAAIADSLVALHSSDPVSVYLSATARMRHPSVAAVEAALYTERSVIRHHAMRRTLWVATPDVVRLLHAAATRKLVDPERTRTCKLLAASGIADPEAWLEDARERVVEALDTHGPMTARTLGERVPALRQPLEMAPGKSYGATVSAHTRVLLLLGFEGAIVRTKPTGTWVNGAYTYAAMHSWLEGGLGEVSLPEAARRLADRWLRSFGPASTADLQWWTGWTAKVTRTALADCAAVEVDLDGRPGWAAPGDEHSGDPAAEEWVALLPSLDPTTMGWKERDWYLPPSAEQAFDANGNAGPTIWVDGRVVGAWAQAPDGEILLHYFERVSRARRTAVEERAADLRATVGDTRFSVRFPGRIQAVLLGPAGSTRTVG